MKRYNPIEADKQFKYAYTNTWKQDFYHCPLCPKIFKKDGCRKHVVLVHQRPQKPGKKSLLKKLPVTKNEELTLEVSEHARVEPQHG